MSLYLVQHGKSRSKEEDPSQPLSESGRAESTHIAEVARGYALRVRGIEHSPSIHWTLMPKIGS